MEWVGVVPRVVTRILGIGGDKIFDCKRGLMTRDNVWEGLAGDLDSEAVSSPLSFRTVMTTRTIHFHTR
jgi:hypothetical protein